METVITPDKIVSNVENVDYECLDKGAINILATGRNISIENERLLWIMYDLKSAIEKDLKDIWKCLDEMESRIE